MKKLTFVVAFIFAIHCTSSAQENVLWKFKTENRVYSSPIIDTDFIYFGSGDHTFYALNKKTGKLAWKYKTQGEVHSSPSIKNNTLFFGSADGNLYALNKQTGKLIWKFKSNGEKMYGLWDYYLSSPKVNGNTVYWGSGDGHLYAINSQTGSVEWKYKTDNVLHATPIFYKNAVLIGGFDGYFYSINKDKGTLNWKFKTIGARYFPKGEIQRAATIDNGIVYFGSRDYNLYALNAETGRGAWNLKQPQGWITAKPIVYKGNVYVGTSDAHIFYSINKDSGIVNWTIPTVMRVYGTATISKDIVYFGTFDGRVMGIDHLTGKTKFEFQTQKSKDNYKTIFNEKGAFKEGFVLYGKDYIEVEAKIHSLGSVLSSPLVENEHIYFGSSDGYMYAVKLK